MSTTNVVAGRAGFVPHEWSGVSGEAERQPWGSGRSEIVVLLQNGHAHLCLGNPGVRVGCEGLRLHARCADGAAVQLSEAVS